MPQHNMDLIIRWLKVMTVAFVVAVITIFIVGYLVQKSNEDARAQSNASVCNGDEALVNSLINVGPPPKTEDEYNTKVQQIQVFKEDLESKTKSLGCHFHFLDPKRPPTP